MSYNHFNNFCFFCTVKVNEQKKEGTKTYNKETGCFNPLPRAVFAFLLRLPYGQFTHPLSRYPYIYEKNFQKFRHEKSWGVGGGTATPPRPEREGVAEKIDKFW